MSTDNPFESLGSELFKPITDQEATRVIGGVMQGPTHVTVLCNTGPNEQGLKVDRECVQRDP